MPIPAHTAGPPTVADLVRPGDTVSSATTAIGDFVSKDAAHEVMNAILAIPAAAGDAIHAENLTRPSPKTAPHASASSAADRLDDLINHSSNNERI